mgnify:CR=1 FL=1
MKSTREGRENRSQWLWPESNAPENGRDNSQDVDIASEYRVLTDGRVFWVQLVAYKPFRMLGYHVSGINPEELMRNWTNFNMALHKPVLDARTGTIWCGPLIGSGECVDENQCG